MALAARLQVEEDAASAAALVRPSKRPRDVECLADGRVQLPRDTPQLDDSTPSADDDASLMLARWLQAEEDAKQPSQSGAAAAATAGGHTRLAPSALPPARLCVSADNAQLMHAIQQALAPFEPTLCVDEVCMARQYDNWTCGYENLASLVRSIGRRQLHDIPAALRPADLQRLIEDAWRAGYSPRDKTKLLGTRKWIGGPEWIIALWHLRLNALIFEIGGDGRRAR